MAHIDWYRFLFVVVRQTLSSMQVKFQLKKVLCMGVAVGNVAMTPDELR